MSPDIHALAGAYVLDAVPEPARAAFEAHLARCDACRAEVAELRGAAVRMGTAVAETPPPQMRSRVLAAVERTRQDRPVVVLAHRLPSLQPRTAVAAAVAAVLVAVAAIGGTIGINRANRRAEQLEKVAAVLTAEDLQGVELAGPGAGTGRDVRLLRSRDEQAGVLVARNMAELPGDRTYQLWLTHDGQVASAGLLGPGGSRPVRHILGERVTSANGVAVSVEPEGGSERPTGDLVLTAGLPAQD